MSGWHCRWASWAAASAAPSSRGRPARAASIPLTTRGLAAIALTTRRAERHAPPLTRRDDGADLAVLLEAESQRRTPEVGLIVVGAARVEAQVPAQRTHVAQLRPGHQPRGPGERREVAPYALVTRDLAQGGE